MQGFSWIYNTTLTSIGMLNRYCWFASCSAGPKACTGCAAAECFSQDAAQEAPDSNTEAICQGTANNLANNSLGQAVFQSDCH